MKTKQLFLLTLLFSVSASGKAQQLKLTENNIDQIVAAMTLEEKAHLLVGGGDDRSINYVPGAAGPSHTIPRLGIPATILTDGPAGVRINPHRQGTDQTFYCTGFPVGVALASTWNVELVEQVGRSIGNEVLEYGCDVLLAPGMNIQRTPLCGRNFEYYSEDPIVAGQMAAAYVRGVQSQGVGTSVKHFSANSQETNRINVDERMSQRTLREIYLKPFEIVVKQAAPWTVMSSYNKINGTWTQSSHDLLTTILRDEWKFSGIVMTDWTNERRTSWDRVWAGNDLLMPGHDWQEQDIIDAVKNGKLKMADVDARVKNFLQFVVRTPRFHGYKYSNKPNLKEHAEMTRKSATEGMVLLKNEMQTLPISNQKKIALFGITSYDFIAGGTGSGDVNKPYVIDLKSGLSNAGYELNKDLTELYETYKKHTDAERLAQGRRSNGRYAELKINRDVLNRQAELNDVAILTIGRQAGEGSDRRIDADFNLTNDERDIIQNICYAFHARGKKVIVILNMGNAIETASWKAMPDAILLAWQPGQEGGNSVSDVLSGKISPSGKLSMTFPNTLYDHPAYFNFPTGPATYSDRRRNTDYTIHEEDIYVGYRYFTTFDREVSYPFGYGLSYTTFEYLAPKVKATKDGFTATITVKNTGSVAGKEVVQLYVKAPNGSFLYKPIRELKAFGKTRDLKPGESQTLSFTVSNYTLASFNDKQSQWETTTGQYDVQFAASSEDIRAHGLYKCLKTQTWPAHDIMGPKEQIKTVGSSLL